jgi:hypothetical protein
MSSSSALRIGVVLSGTVIAEHVLRDRRPFSIGQSTRTTVSVPVSDLPRHWDLLALVDGGIQVRLPAGAEARISDGAELWTRADLDRRGTVAHGHTTVTLPVTARGRVDLGEVRILFQGVRAPVAVAPPRLPRALQSTLTDRIDGRLAAFVAASICAHVGIMAVAAWNDPPAQASVAKRAIEQYQDETIAVIDADDPLLDFGEAPPEADAPAKPDPAPAVQVPTPPKSTDPIGRPPRPIAADPGVLHDPAADSARLADALFADEDGGKLAGDVEPRAPGTDLGKQLEEIKAANANAKFGEGGEQVTRDRDGVRPGTVTEPLIPGTPPAVVDNTDKTPEKVPEVRIKPIPPKRQPDGPDVDSIIRKISTTYVGGLQRCYKLSLRDDATLSGKIILNFTVTDRGKLTDGDAAGVDAKLEKCVEGLMNGWSFTPVVDKDGDPTDVDIRLPLVLTPV